MINDERVITYIHSLESDDSPFLRAIAQDARDSFVPIVRPETARFLRTLAAMKSPKQILEVGTAVGYSALLLAQCVSEECRITTIEKDEERIAAARKNFAEAEMTERITLLEGDAADILAGLVGPYDFIFMDAAKGQYIRFLPDVLRLMPVGGVLVSDNVLQDGDVIESRFAVERRNRTIHTRMREYLYQLTHSPELQTAIIPIGDGVTVSVRLETRPGG